MGTRALILKNNKKWVYVHFDGYPNELGKTLKKIKGLSNAKQKHVLHRKHQIDYDFEKVGWVTTNPRKPFKVLRTKEGKHDDFFSYIYNIKRGVIYYSKNSGQTGNYPWGVISDRILNRSNWTKL